MCLPPLTRFQTRLFAEAAQRFKFCLPDESQQRIDRFFESRPFTTTTLWWLLSSLNSLFSMSTSRHFTRIKAERSCCHCVILSLTSTSSVHPFKPLQTDWCNFRVCCCCLPDPFRGMGAWRKTMEPQKPGNSPGSGPEVIKRQRVAKE